MVNENKGKVYEPRPVYNRKLLRLLIRTNFIKKYGKHEVNRNLSENFHKIRAGE